MENLSIGLLDKFGNDTNHYELIKEILNDILDCNPNILQLFKSINQLRRYKIYEPKAFSQVFNVVYENLGKLLYCNNELLVSSILILLKELFNDPFGYEYIEYWIDTLLPCILSISKNNNLCSEIANKCLNICAGKLFYENTLLILLNAILDKDQEISENAYRTLNSLINNYDETLFVNLDWNNIFDILSDVFTYNYRVANLFCNIIKEKLDDFKIYQILHKVEFEETLMLCFNLFQFNHNKRIEFNKFKLNIN